MTRNILVTTAVSIFYGFLNVSAHTCNQEEEVNRETPILDTDGPKKAQNLLAIVVVLKP